MVKQNNKRELSLEIHNSVKLFKFENFTVYNSLQLCKQYIEPVVHTLANLKYKLLFVKIMNWKHSSPSGWFRRRDEYFHTYNFRYNESR